MSGLEKILNHIETSAATTAQKIIDDANAEAAKILASGKEATLEKESVIKKQAEADAIAARKRVESSSQMHEKKLLLQAKQYEVESVLNEAVEILNGQDDATYFDIIYRMIAKYAQPLDGVIRFSKRDLDRLPSDFTARAVQAAGGNVKLTVSDEPCKIDGGFILDYGYISENCSFDAIIEESKDKLQDKVGQILFS